MADSCLRLYGLRIQATVCGKRVQPEGDMAEFTRPQVRTMIVWGAIGGALPTLARIAAASGTAVDSPIPNLGVLIGLALYAVIGGIVARAMENPEMKHSLFSGIAAPAIVASLLTGATEGRIPSPPQ